MKYVSSYHDVAKFVIGSFKILFLIKCKTKLFAYELFAYELFNIV